MGRRVILAVAKTDIASVDNASSSPGGFVAPEVLHYGRNDVKQWSISISRKKFRVRAGEFPTALRQTVAPRFLQEVVDGRITDKAAIQRANKEGVVKFEGLFELWDNQALLFIGCRRLVLLGRGSSAHLLECES